MSHTILQPHNYSYSFTELPPPRVYREKTVIWFSQSQKAWIQAPRHWTYRFHFQCLSFDLCSSLSNMENCWPKPQAWTPLKPFQEGSSEETLIYFSNFEQLFLLNFKVLKLLTCLVWRDHIVQLTFITNIKKLPGFLMITISTTWKMRSDTFFCCPSQSDTSFLHSADDKPKNRYMSQEPHHCPGTFENLWFLIQLSFLDFILPYLIHQKGGMKCRTHMADSHFKAKQGSR